MDYMTLKEASEKWGVSSRQVNYYCVEGRIPGAVKMAGVWLLPKGCCKAGRWQNKGRESTEVSRILLLEDDEALGRGICMALETPNCTVTHCSTRLQAIKILQGVVFDLLILDINLPDGSGLELLRTLRQNGTSTPAILLTANDLELDEVTGLEAGADDYITKPFSLAVLRARVNAQLRRSVPVKQERIELNGFILDFTRMEFSKEGTIIDLSKTEQRLLRLLVENRGRTLPRELLLEKVWDGGEFVDENALSVAVRRLRGKLGNAPIRTVYGVGYTWEVSK